MAEMKALTMKSNKTQALLLMTCLASASSAAWADGDTAEATAAAGSEKAAKKISKAIAEEVEDFVIIGQEEVEAPTGYKGMQYTVDTSSGKRFKCEILEPSKIGKIFTWGMGSGADATCTEFKGAGKGQATTHAGRPAALASAAPKASASGAAAKAESTTPVAVNDKAMKKISKSIAEEIGDFRVIKQEEVEAPTGYNGVQYTVQTNSGSKYKCEILEPSKLGKIATWGMGSGADAVCVDFTKGSQDKGKTNQASCNALLRAAGKCS
jgi:hypothetical protein